MRYDQWEPSCSMRTGMSNLTVAFLNAPKNERTLVGWRT